MKTKPTERGSLAEHGDHATLTFHRFYPHRIEDVWEAISTPEGLQGWLLATEASIEARVGGRIEMVSGPPGYRSTGTVLAWEPPTRLAYEWNVAPVPEMPDGERAVFRYELSRADGGTVLLATVERISRATARGFLPGLHVFLDRLAAQLAGAPLPDWLTRFGELRGEYPEWTSDATDPGA
jgi:uncharacterized protein YndB with AHSA1/START domain